MNKLLIFHSCLLNRSYRVKKDKNRMRTRKKETQLPSSRDCEVKTKTTSLGKGAQRLWPVSAPRTTFTLSSQPGDCGESRIQSNNVRRNRTDLTTLSVRIATNDPE